MCAERVRQSETEKNETCRTLKILKIGTLLQFIIFTRTLSSWGNVGTSAIPWQPFSLSGLDTNLAITRCRLVRVRIHVCRLIKLQLISFVSNHIRFDHTLYNLTGLQCVPPRCPRSDSLCYRHVSLYIAFFRPFGYMMMYKILIPLYVLQLRAEFQLMLARYKVKLRFRSKAPSKTAI